MSIRKYSLYSSCPHCGVLFSNPSRGSFGEFKAWSDSSYLSGPWSSNIEKCSICNEYFWLDEAKGDISVYNLKFLQCNDLLVALKSGLGNTRKRELLIRLKIWWAIYLYDRQCLHHQDQDGRTYHDARLPISDGETWTPNLQRINELLDESNPPERIMKAETCRELGSFSEALNLLREKLPEYELATERICRLCHERKQSIHHWHEFDLEFLGDSIPKFWGEVEARLRAPMIIDPLAYFLGYFDREIIIVEGGIASGRINNSISIRSLVPSDEYPSSVVESAQEYKSLPYQRLFLFSYFFATLFDQSIPSSLREEHVCFNLPDQQYPKFVGFLATCQHNLHPGLLLLIATLYTTKEEESIATNEFHQLSDFVVNDNDDENEHYIFSTPKYPYTIKSLEEGGVSRDTVLKLYSELSRAVRMLPTSLMPYTELPANTNLYRDWMSYLADKIEDKLNTIS